MSISAAITLTIVKKSKKMTWVDIIQLLLDNGWSINDHGMMSYLPLHDNDMFDWQREPINNEKLITILTEKETLREQLGVCITWKDTNIGGSLLAFSDDQVLFSIDINRQTMQVDKKDIVTDVNWYLSKINPILLQNPDIYITSTNFFEDI